VPTPVPPLANYPLALTRRLRGLRANPQIGRAKALRRSMAELITKGTPYVPHPELGPLVLVGEGAC